MTSRWFHWLAALSCTGCLADGTPLDYAKLGVRIERADAAGSSPSLCTALPVLLGSVVDERRALDPELAISVRATRDSARVTFPGAVAANPQREISRDELIAGYAESIVAVSPSGLAYSVELMSDCE